MKKKVNRAPELITSQWFNCDASQSLSAHLGKVVVVEVFQMLCPGCVSHGLPQAQRIHEMFPKSEVSVLGLHSVFEHHDAMTPTSLRAFLYEYGLTFPVGVDAPSNSSDMPRTMAAYAMRGTPTLLLIKRDGVLAGHHFGQVPDLQVGAEIAALIGEKATSQNTGPLDSGSTSDACDEDSCAVKDG